MMPSLLLALLVAPQGMTELELDLRAAVARREMALDGAKLSVVELTFHSSGQLFTCSLHDAQFAWPREKWAKYTAELGPKAFPELVDRDGLEPRIRFGEVAEWMRVHAVASVQVWDGERQLSLTPQGEGLWVGQLRTALDRSMRPGDLLPGVLAGGDWLLGASEKWERVDVQRLPRQPERWVWTFVEGRGRVSTAHRLVTDSTRDLAVLEQSFARGPYDELMAALEAGEVEWEVTLRAHDFVALAKTYLPTRVTWEARRSELGGVVWLRYMPGESRPVAFDVHVLPWECRGGGAVVRDELTGEVETLGSVPQGVERAARSGRGSGL